MRIPSAIFYYRGVVRILPLGRWKQSPGSARNLWAHRASLNTGEVLVTEHTGEVLVTVYG